MNDVTVIDRFLDIFSRYIDSGFGLLHGEVVFLTATLIVIDMTLAGLFWAMGHATGQGEDVIAKLIRKVLYVGAFAYIIGNFNWLAGIVFRSFAGLGLTASGSTLSMENFLQPGRLAKVGIDAGAPILQQIGNMAGFPEVFVNITPIVVMFLAWLIVLLCFFVLAIQLFITLIEFKLTTLAGFVLVPFALWNKTAFLAEKVLGNVVSSGIKVLVLAVIVGIGSGLFAEFQIQPAEPSIDHSVVVMLASLTLLALGIFGPGIATGLVSGGPQLGAGAMAGAALGAAGAAVAVSAAATGVGGAVAAGARMAPAAAKLAGSGARAAASTASSAKSAYQAGSSSAGGGLKGAAAGVGNVAKTGAQATGQKVRVRKQYQMRERQLVTGQELMPERADTQKWGELVEKYRLIETQQDGLTAADATRASGSRTFDLTSRREKRTFSHLSLVAEVSRYLNRSPLEIEELLDATKDGSDKLVAITNEFNELLYDEIIPRLFRQLYDLDESQQTEEHEVDLIKLPPNGYYEVSAAKDKIVRMHDAQIKDDERAKSFHLDTYCFDSGSENWLFWDLLREQRVKKIYFTGMLTHGQSDFFIQYIDPDSRTVRSYFPDFIFQREELDGSLKYVIVEVKADNQIEDTVVQAKKDFAQQIAVASGMEYRILKSSDADKRHFRALL